MKIGNQGGMKALSAGDSSGTAASSIKPSTSLSSNEIELQSSKLQPALNKLSEMPELDHARIAQLRDAIEKGEISFNATRLAALIQKYHDSK